MKKTDIKTIEKVFKDKEINMIGEYKGYNIPILLEKNGYKFKMSYGHFLEGCKPNFFGKRCNFQKENIELFIKRMNCDIELINIENKTIKGKHRICLKLKCCCGNLFNTTFDHISNSKDILCPQCSRENGIKKRKQNYNKKYRKNIESQGYTIVDDLKDIYALKRVEVIQNSTGFKGYINPNRKIKQMLIFSLFHNKDNYIYNCNVLLVNSGYNTKALKLVDNDTKILSKCECGNIYKANLRSFYRGNCLCSNCNIKTSKNERKIKKWLDDNNIEYIQEFIINSCRDNYPLPFDFYIKKNNSFIEIDGEQHEHPVAFDGNLGKAKIKFEIQKKHDNIKNEYCKKYNIPLLRISYKDFENNKYINKISNFIYNTAQD